MAGLLGQNSKPGSITTGAFYCGRGGEYERAEERFEKALSLAKDQGNKDLIARAYHGMGVLYGDVEEDKEIPIEKNESAWRYWMK